MWSKVLIMNENNSSKTAFISGTSTVQQWHWTRDCKLAKLRTLFLYPELKKQNCHFRLVKTSCDSRSLNKAWGQDDIILWSRVGWPDPLSFGKKNKGLARQTRMPWDQMIWVRLMTCCLFTWSCHTHNLGLMHFHNQQTELYKWKHIFQMKKYGTFQTTG